MNDRIPPPSSPSSPPLVWVKQGKEQQPAFLIEDGGKKHLIKWASTDYEEWVDAEHVERQLTPRRHCQTPDRKRSPSKILDLTESPSASPKKNKKQKSFNRVSLSPSTESTSKLASDKENRNETIQEKQNAPSKTDNEESDDDEVEVLLTILPSSPKRRVTRPSLQQAFNCAAAACEESSSSSDESSIENKPIAALRGTKPASLKIQSVEESNLKQAEYPKEKKTPQNEEDKELKEAVYHDASTKDDSNHPLAATVGNCAPQTPRYSERSSAYIQSMAEICHAILWDCRWRVGPEQHRLFTWEHGEDLSAVHALGRCYEPLPQSKPPPCTCLLCCDLKQEPKNKKCDISVDVNREEQSSKTEGIPTLPGISMDTSNDRSLNLYSRLFSRKGPWFRVDDVFKYYSPKENPSDAPQSSGHQASPTAPINKPSSPSKFFLPRSTHHRPKTKSSSTQKTIENLIDFQLVDRHLDCLSLMVEDLQRLHQMGLIRSFRDEEECGKTVGEVQKYGLLRMEERRSIVAMLGGDNKRKTGLNGRHTPTGYCGTANENQIWKQMCQQQSISFLAHGGGKATVLPVSKHVDEALIHSLTTTIVLKSSRVDYLPAPILRSATVTVKEAVNRLLTAGNISRGISAMCVRLREAPTHTLRRFCRLYLCATSGPGDMRGNGSNGWRSIAENFHNPSLEQSAVKTTVVQTPGAHSWYHVSYPGRDYRFKLIPCHFLRAHQPRLILQDDGSTGNSESHSSQDQVFSSVQSFHLWEQCVELRSIVDYLVELNDLMQYNERRLARYNEDHDSVNGEVPMRVPQQAPRSQTLDASVDFLDLLTREGRSKLIDVFLVRAKVELVAVSHERQSTQHCKHKVHQAIERDVAKLHGASCTKEEGIEQSAPVSRLKGESEMVLGAIAVVAIHVLEVRNELASEEDIGLIASRPWLRHMCWEGCLAYLLWDIIPILEKRKYHDFAVKALEVLLLGRTRTDCESQTGASVAVPTIDTIQGASGETFLAQFYLSRRARGKAYERLIIDYVHLLRQNAKNKAAETKAAETKVARRAKKRKPPAKNAPKVEDPTARICEDLISTFAPTGQITFSATRALARRLKKPLSDTIGHLSCFEVKELGHRLANSSDFVVAATGKTSEMKKYSDWTPLTDQAVANQMALDENTIGRRCSFIGFENDRDPLSLASLNVEELSMEYYRTGRLPNTEDALKGGWVGWHDEGGKVRTLFRILCSATVLGMDWGCFYETMDDEASRREHATIHLTPYHRAPCDLHVGAELKSTGETRGFYLRRRQTINRFLERLSFLEPQDLCDLVYDAIASRLEYFKSTHRDDPLLQGDVQQVRTLSLVAAGLGSKTLAAMFRCLFFDYRHYSGGLPDLSLVRAIYVPTAEDADGSLVELGDWVGEMFSEEFRESQEAQQLVGLLEDAEFLGCSKVGDSGGRASNRSTRNGRQQPKNTDREGTKSERQLELPSKLKLNHNNRIIKPECMLVEVKSHNDRLDPRQEDWLNILDRHGNARVCKFFNKKEPQKAKGKQNAD